MLRPAVLHAINQSTVHQSKFMPLSLLVMSKQETTSDFWIEEEAALRQTLLQQKVSLPFSRNMKTVFIAIHAGSLYHQVII